MNQETRYLDFESHGYKFSVIVDERGIRLGSSESVKDFTIREVKRYKSALVELCRFLDDVKEGRK
jgi:hypothetical protein